MSKRIEITYELAMAAGRDAGNRSMREGGRTKWAVKDWNAACRTFERLYPESLLPAVASGFEPSKQPQAEQGKEGEG